MKNLKLIILLLIIFALGCTKDKTSVEHECESNSPSFNTQVLPIFQNNCSNCHASQTPILNDYSSISQSAESALSAMQHVSAIMPPYPSVKLSDSLIQIVNCWIHNGKQDN